MEKDNGQFFVILGWLASITAIAMYVSYIPQIENNLHGEKGTWVQPLVAGVNCTLWVIYGLMRRPKRDWPIIMANLPGIIFGSLTFVTAL